MALVAYSDSEGSDNESIPAPASKALRGSYKQAFQKITNASEPRKIKVDLPTVKPEVGRVDAQQPPIKRARTTGAFSGFNSLLPAPKQPAKSAPKAGVSLKTSSEAVFSRAPPTAVGDWNGDDGYYGDGVKDSAQIATDDTPVVKEEVKIVGKGTKFRPLSVSNKKKPLKKVAAVEKKIDASGGLDPPSLAHQAAPASNSAAKPATPKRSLFSVQPTDQDTRSDLITEDYEPMNGENDTEESDVINQTQAAARIPVAPPANSNSLQSVASDLNLTPAQQRQLFGRHNKDQDINITHFNLDSEYAANEQLRQAGEVVEHRAVKAIAPGKHSLQQLVNNARTQQEGLEDKWAAGRQARGEGGSKYGWGR